MYSGQMYAERKVLPSSRQRKVSYLMDQSFSNWVSLLWMRHIHHTIHFADMTLVWCHHSIWLRDRKPDSFIGVVYLLSQSIPNVDEGMIYLKLLIMAGEAKRLDENPILSHSRQRQVWIWLTLTQCDVVTKPKRLHVKQWLLLRCFVGKIEAQKPKHREWLNVKLQTTWCREKN